MPIVNFLRVVAIDDFLFVVVITDECLESKVGPRTTMGEGGENKAGKKKNAQPVSSTVETHDQR